MQNIRHHRSSLPLLFAVLLGVACSSSSSKVQEADAGPERDSAAPQDTAALFTETGTNLDGTYVAECTYTVPYPAIFWVTKTAPECATVWFIALGENHSGIWGSTQNLNWGAGINRQASCSLPSSTQQGTNSEGTGTGTFTVLFDSGDCERAKISLHATVNVIDANGVEQSVRMDVDDLVPTRKP